MIQVDSSFEMEDNTRDRGAAFVEDAREKEWMSLRRETIEKESRSSVAQRYCYEKGGFKEKEIEWIKEVLV